METPRVVETVPNDNPYGHLSEAELTDLRYVKQERYEQLQDQYRDAYQDWALVMNALKALREGQL